MHRLCLQVLEKVQKELIQHGNSGISVMEMSHRSPEFTKINEAAQNAIRQLLNIPSNYKVLFLQGGGTGMFAAVPLNLLSDSSASADYLITGMRKKNIKSFKVNFYFFLGTWSAKAAKEAAKYGKVNLVVPKTDKYTGVPSRDSWNLSPNAKYVWYCANETVHGKTLVIVWGFFDDVVSGVEFQDVPETHGVPLVVDMSSNILSRPFDVSKASAVMYLGEG